MTGQGMNRHIKTKGRWMHLSHLQKPRQTNRPGMYSLYNVFCLSRLVSFCVFHLFSASSEIYLAKISMKSVCARTVFHTFATKWQYHCVRALNWFRLHISSLFLKIIRYSLLKGVNKVMSYAKTLCNRGKAMRSREVKVQCILWYQFCALSFTGCIIEENNEAVGLGFDRCPAAYSWWVCQWFSTE